MRTVVFALGSRGSAQPVIALGYGLARAGHDVVIATHPEYQSSVEKLGLGFLPIRINMPEVFSQRLGQEMLASGRNPLAFTRALKKISESEIMADCLRETKTAAQGAELVLFNQFAFVAYHVTEALRIPAIGLSLAPSARTREFTNMSFPQRDKQGVVNLASHVLAEQLYWHPLRRVTNRWRRELGLAPAPLWGLHKKMVAERQPLLHLYSPLLLPKPADWPSWLHVTGYSFLDDKADRLPADLEAFIDEGPAPVYVGFGSMVSRAPKATGELVLDAIQRAGVRAVVASGWGGLELPTGRAGTNFVIKEVPHRLLFPKMAAVVHHGGIGTTMAVARAGVPSVPVPFFMDQPFWSHRLALLGTGTTPLPFKALKADKLADAIKLAATDRSMAAKAQELGARIAAEDGLKTASALVEEYATRWSRQGPGRPSRYS